METVWSGFNCSMADVCANTKCPFLRMQVLGAMFTCGGNAISDAANERFGPWEKPDISFGAGSGGPGVFCHSFIRGTEEELDAIEKMAEEWFKEGYQ